MVRADDAKGMYCRFADCCISYRNQCVSLLRVRDSSNTRIRRASENRTESYAGAEMTRISFGYLSSSQRVGSFGSSKRKGSKRGSSRRLSERVCSDSPISARAHSNQRVGSFGSANEKGQNVARAGGLLVVRGCVLTALLSVVGTISEISGDHLPSRAVW